MAALRIGFVGLRRRLARRRRWPGSRTATARSPVEEADVVVALGGDGFMLQTLHAVEARGTPVYGMNRGTVGFLMNAYREGALPERLAAAEHAVINPLRMRAETVDGRVEEALAINEVSLLRSGPQAAKLRVSVDGTLRMEELVCDGALVATPAGSTAYNYSAHGPVLPIGAEVLALTAIAPFRPRRWRGALVPKGVDRPLRGDRGRQAPGPRRRRLPPRRERRPWSRSAPSPAVRHHLLFDPGHGLDERLIREQFA